MSVSSEPKPAEQRSVSPPPGRAPVLTPPAAPTNGAAPTAPADVSPAPEARRRPRLLSRRVLLPLAAVVLIVAAVVGYSFYREGQMYVSTDNAQLTGQPIQVGSMNAGQVQAVFPTIGSTVHKGDVLAQVALPSQVGTAQNGTPKMGFLGAGDTKVDVTAPLDGLVIATPMGVGATVQPGQPIVTLIDPSQMWVTANIEETSIGRVKVGQPVTVHVDALSADVPGKVEAITPATAASASILPASNASGNFNKVTQLVPVRVSVNLGNQLALLGTSVEVKVKVAD
jgi:multidrug resistance efflux pump